MRPTLLPVIRDDRWIFWLFAQFLIFRITSMWRLPFSTRGLRADLLYFARCITALEVALLPTIIGRLVECGPSRGDNFIDAHAQHTAWDAAGHIVIATCKKSDNGPWLNLGPGFICSAPIMAPKAAMGFGEKLEKSRSRRWRPGRTA